MKYLNTQNYYFPNNNTIVFFPIYRQKFYYYRISYLYITFYYPKDRFLNYLVLRLLFFPFINISRVFFLLEVLFLVRGLQVLSLFLFLQTSINTSVLISSTYTHKLCSFLYFTYLIIYYLFRVLGFILLSITLSTLYLLSSTTSSYQ